MREPKKQASDRSYAEIRGVVIHINTRNIRRGKTDATGPEQAPGKVRQDERQDELHPPPSHYIMAIIPPILFFFKKDNWTLVLFRAMSESLHIRTVHETEYFTLPRYPLKGPIMYQEKLTGNT